MFTRKSANYKMADKIPKDTCPLDDVSLAEWLGVSAGNNACDGLKIYGQGKYGIVLSTQRHGNNVVKVGVTEKPREIEKEIKAQSHFAREKLSKSPIKFCTKKLDDAFPIYTRSNLKSEYHIVFSKNERADSLLKTVNSPSATIFMIALEKIDNTLYNYLGVDRSDAELDKIASEIARILDREKKSGITHGDLHFENIAVGGEGPSLTLSLIDFGFANRTRFVPIVEVIQILRSLTVLRDGTASNRKRLRSRLAVKQIIAETVCNFATASNRAINRTWDENKTIVKFYGF